MIPRTATYVDRELVYSNELTKVSTAADTDSFVLGVNGDFVTLTMAQLKSLLDGRYYTESESDSRFPSKMNATYEHIGSEIEIDLGTRNPNWGILYCTSGINEDSYLIWRVNDGLYSKNFSRTSSDLVSFAPASDNKFMLIATTKVPWVNWVYLRL